MKKRLLFLTSLLAVGGLSGCDFIDNLTGKNKIDESKWIVVPEFESGKNAEKNAILEAINNKSICVDRGGNDLFPNDQRIELREDDGDFISVATKVIVDKYTVELTWDFKETQATFAKKSENEKGYLVNIKYPGFGNPDSTFEWSLAKITCGSAVSTNTKSNYSAKVVAASVSYTPMTVAELYKNHDEEKSVTIGSKTYTYYGSNELIDYEYVNNKGAYSTWWKTGRDPSSDNNYIYAEVSGKVIYLSDDGNWGLLADGDKVIEIYSGNQLDLSSKKYPDLGVGKYVSVKGEINHYYGNFQLSYIKEITACDSAKITEPSGNFKALTGSMLQALELKAGTVKPDNSGISVAPQYKQFATTLSHNELVSVTGTVVTKKITQSNRFVFYVDVEGHLVQIAYDYHCDNKSGSVVGNALTGVINVGQTVSIKGTYRFNHGSEKTLVPTTGAGGQITIAPYQVDQIA